MREVVVVIFGTVGVSVKLRRRRIGDTQSVVVPLRIRVDAFLLGANLFDPELSRLARRITWNRIKSPVNKNPQLRVHIPRWNSMLSQRFFSRFEFLRGSQKRRFADVSRLRACGRTADCR